MKTKDLITLSNRLNSVLKFLLLGLLVSTTQAAHLQVQSQSLNLGAVPKNAVRVPFLQLKLNAQNGTVNVKSLTVERSGLSHAQDFGRVWAETQNYRRTLARKFNNDDQVELSFRSPLKVAEQESVDLTVYTNLNFSRGGKTARFSLLNINHDGTSTSPTTPASVKIKSIPRTKSKVPYNRTKYRIKCQRGQCQLAPRD